MPDVVNTFQDLIDLLERRPDLRDALRRMFLEQQAAEADRGFGDRAPAPAGLGAADERADARAPGRGARAATPGG
jgi:hypothetical protein